MSLMIATVVTFAKWEHFVPFGLTELMELCVGCQMFTQYEDIITQQVWYDSCAAPVQLLDYLQTTTDYYYCTS